LNILVIDDHPLVRDAMGQLVSRLGEQVCVYEAADSHAAMRTAREHHDLDLVLLDLNLPGLQGMAVLEQLRLECPSAPVVIVSMFKDSETILGAIRLGAMGFIPKSSDRETMLNALRLVLSGSVYLPPELAITEVRLDGGPGRDFTARQGPSLRAELTGRQTQVLALVMKGRTNKEICRDLGLAERTVKAHLTAVLNALKVTSRTQAVIAANQMGLDPEDLLHATPGSSPG